MDAERRAVSTVLVKRILATMSMVLVTKDVSQDTRAICVHRVMVAMFYVGENITLFIFFFSFK